MPDNLAYVNREWDHQDRSTSAMLGNCETLTGSGFRQGQRRIAAELIKLLELRPNWDSYGARPINESCISSTFDILANVMFEETPTPSIIPTSDGHVQFEWHLRGIDLEVEVNSPSSLHVMYEDHHSNEPPQELSLDYDLRPLWEFVRILTHRA